MRLPWRDGVAEVDARGRITLAVPRLPPVGIAVVGADGPGLDDARLVLVEEIANTIAFMVSEECSFTTGFTFDISGGRATY